VRYTCHWRPYKLRAPTATCREARRDPRLRPAGTYRSGTTA
jgi:hypothetical protein